MKIFIALLSLCLVHGPLFSAVSLSSFDFPLLAQTESVLDEFDDDDLSVVAPSLASDLSSSAPPSLSDLWESRGQGYLGTYYNHGKFEDTYAAMIRITYSQPYKASTFVSTIDFLSVQKKIYGYEKDNPLLSFLLIKKNALHFRELYSQTTLSSQLQLNIGRQLIVWGQTPGYSVVDFILPMDMDINPLRVVSKLDRRIPLEAISLSYFPFSQLELTATVFNDMPQPSLIRQQLNADVAWYKINHLYNDRYTNDYIYNPDTPPAIIYKNQQKPFSFRVLWRRPSFTFGLTYFEGMHWNYVESHRIIYAPQYTYFGPYNQRSSTPSSYRYEADLNQVTFGFYRKTVWAIELSKHFWDYTFIFELSRESLPYVIPTNIWFFQDYIEQTSATTNLTRMYRYFSSLALHADYPWCDFVFILFGVFDDHRDFPSGDMIQEWKSQRPLNSLLFSAMVSINLPKSTKLGAGLGLLPYGVGVRFFLSSEFRETWQWSLSPQYVAPLFEDSANFAKKHGATLSFSLSRKF
ncbi:MAG: hypothetical protein VW378_04145 [bacterium]